MDRLWTAIVALSSFSVGETTHNEGVTEPIQPSRQAPKRPPATIQELTLLVRVPDKPAEVRAFTAAERAEADRYAAATGGIVDDLPA